MTTRKKSGYRKSHHSRKAHIPTSQYTMNNCAIISRAKIQHNIDVMRKLAKTEIMPVIKADAYGHGIIEIAKFLRSIGIQYIGVATVNEALELRNNGDNGRLLAWLYDSYSLDLSNAFHNDIEIAVFDEEAIPRIRNELRKYNHKQINITIFVDTGFHRNGIPYERAINVIEKLVDIPNVNINGLMSHLIESSIPNSSIVKDQLSKFRRLRNELREIGIIPNNVHIANTNACFNYDVSDFTISRVGSGIFGLSIETYVMKRHNIQYVMKVQTRIIQIKRIRKGECIGYGCDYIAPRNMMICILCIGYADIPIYNYDNIYYYIRGTRRRVLGRPNMDQIVCISKPGDKLHDLAYLSHELQIHNTEPYDKLFIMTHIGRRLKRVYI